MRWVDVDLETATIDVCRALVHAQGRVRMKHPKRGQRRSLRIGTHTVRVLTGLDAANLALFIRAVHTQDGWH